MAILSTQTIESINESDLNQVPSKLLRRSFGQGNDSIELSIFDPQGKLLIKDSSFREFKSYITPGGIAGKSKVTSIDIDYEQVLRDYGYNNGTYVMNFSFQRQITSIGTPFSISEISPSRTELRIVPNNITQADFELDIINLNSVIRESAYIKDINLSFTKDTALAVNIVLDKNKTGLVKLYNPLPFNISTGESFKIFEEIINPIEVTIELASENETQTVTGIDIGPPNFNLTNEDIFTVPSSYKTFDQILTNGAASSSFNNIQNILSEGNIQLDLEFDNVDTPSGYHFENFIHFSSATERLQNFKYKLGLLESYSSSLANLDNITGDVADSSFVTENRTILQNKENKLLQSFDYYERYLYYEKGPYAWPKTNDTLPYINAKTESAAANSWFGVLVDNYGTYNGGQMASASKFDDYNPYNLTNTIPPHIKDNTQNDKYTLFVEMIAQHFDGIWVYMDSITDINEAYSGLKDGISKDLVLNQLTSRGISAYDQFSNSSLYEYLIGDDGTGTFQFNTNDTATIISASNAPIPKGDIAKEIWKRLYHNSSYLLKTKGTERGLKALIACYGIPETVLHVKEYGGPLVDKTGFRTFSYQKESKMAQRNDDTTNKILALDTGYDQYFTNTKTIQLRVLPEKTNNPPPQDFISLVGIRDISIGVSQSIDPTLGKDSGSFAHLVITSGSNSGAGYQDTSLWTQGVSTNQVPFYNGKPWNISIIINSGSSANNSMDVYATQTNFHKNTYLAETNLPLTDNHFGQITSIVLGSSLTNNSFGNVVGSFTGSIQEYRRWYDEKLTKDTIVTQSLSPFNYNGNTVSSSYENLRVRVAFGSDNKNIPGVIDDSTISNYNEAPNSTYRNGQGIAIYGNMIDEISIEETHHLTTPDTVGSGMVSDKVRIDNGTFDDNFLDPFVPVETSPQDRQPLDYSDLGVFFSPTFEINEDIIYTLGGFRLDDYIGDPTHYTSGSYPDLKTLKKIYTQKLDSKLNIADYIRTIQFFDHTLFKMIKEFVPAKANLKTGLVIEPHYLERTKIAGTNVDYEQLTEHLANYSPSGSISSTNETEHNVFIDVTDYIDDGSYGTAVENVAQVNKKSKFYYLR